MSNLQTVVLGYLELITLNSSVNISGVMSIISRIFGKEKIKAATISLVGPPKSGKTTLVRYLTTGEPVLEPVPTTLGIDVRKNAVNISGWSLTAIDTGGQETYRQAFWELSIQQADAVIFVIDATVRESTDPKGFSLMEKQFEYLVKVMPEDMPLLILLNKQDLVDFSPMNIEEAVTVFPKDLLHGRIMSFVACSAKFGQGVQEAITWLIDRMNE